MVNMPNFLNGWRVCYVDEKKHIYLDGMQVQNRVIRLSILAAIESKEFPITGWIKKDNGTWEFDKEGPFKTYF
jgi:hypothetical protein